MKQKIYVCGHQNPDTDSIVAALSYAFLRGLDKMQAVRLGVVNPETSYVLRRFGFDEPQLIKTARTQICDIDFDHPPLISPDMQIIEAWEKMRAGKIKTMPVVRGDGGLSGVISPADIADCVMRLAFKSPRRDMTLDEFCEDISSQNYTVAGIMSTERLICFHSDDYLDDVRTQMIATRYRCYPVLDGDGKVLGSVSRYHLINHNRKKFVLVDHNEKAQSVPGLEQADVVEIIDHHRLADIQTGKPMYFRNEPVGSTTTIIAGMFAESGANPPPGLAGLMLAGILSDTVIFKSPTCTQKDREMAQWLSGLANVADQELGKELFQAFDAQLSDLTCEQILLHDFKEYALGGTKVGIGQIIVWQSGKVSAEEMQKTIEELRKRERFDLVVFMQTEIDRGGSRLSVAAAADELIKRCFGKTTGEPFFMEGVMSRKKQIVPLLSQALI